MHEAMLYEKQDQRRVRCLLCAHGCLIKPGERGICQVRENQEGTLYTLVWGKPISGSVDPIEKKPLFHFLPGTTSYSIATLGCNFQCGFCQNWNISQYPRREKGAEIPGGGPLGELVPPEHIVGQARAAGCASISYTYTEPTIYFEYAHDCMKLALAQGLKNVFVSNGYESEQCVRACQGLLHAANIDLKSFRDGFYKSECKARLQPVLDTLKRMFAAGIWLEVTTLVIPGKNDDPAELKDLTGFLVAELSPEVPWHVSAYHPQFKYLDGGPGPTPVKSLERALAIGKEAGLLYVYAGNVPGHGSESTACPGCERMVVGRSGYRVLGLDLKDGACSACGRPIPGVWA
ncbi:MAG: AmmeMemoRadiSam system radical SAM enzyme [Desulfarculus sp.]|nr:AmmeMemoRadiSam system radical SAM enzyme [Desulfarculus sp.]